MTSTLQVEVLCKEQFQGVLKWLLNEGLHFEVQMSEKEGAPSYVLTVHNVPWMINMVALTKQLNKKDYDSDS